MGWVSLAGCLILMIILACTIKEMVSAKDIVFGKGVKDMPHLML